MAKAAVLTEIKSDLELQKYEVPKAPPAGAVVDVALGGICGTDIHLCNGHLPLPLPLAMGHEAAGIIRDLGEGLTHDSVGHELNVGDRVGWANSIPCGECYECLILGERTLCKNRKIYGINRPADAAPHLNGGWGESIVLEKGTVIVKLPDDVAFEEVITLGCAGPTAVHGVLEYLTIQPGDIVAVQGAGPVGLASAMFAKVMGAGKVILIGAPTGRMETARQINAADEFIDMEEYTTPAARLDALRALTPSGRGADVVIECAGVPAAVSESIDLAAPNGQLLVLGQYTDHGPTPLNPHYITKKQLKVFGSWGFSERHYVKYIQALPQLVSRHNLKSILTTYKLEDVNSALRDVAEGKVTKAALRP
ncbi:zinc-binding dehydrogenase [Corynebacterium accolens]|uniref:zinc-binding dehydrogenase n=1 Tax=Corynebacterium accolens TaxID=38284 RepID=UPI00267044C3|nr:zinc-binding dehydrogenase [Corynebacterium accolens]WKS55398.1 zinc-binding dehydrogenase [Corynebacterium accolens]